jgi:hypothetical protein
MIRFLVFAGSALLLAGCSNHSKGGDEVAGDAVGKEKDKSDPAGGVDVGFLLTMSYNEAKRLSPESMELPPYYKIAADEITVTSRKPDGSPRKVRAKGHVFLQIDYREELNALGQEALIDGTEVIMRGKPLLRRGKSVVEGLSDLTVFYIEGVRLQVIGLHRITNEGGVTPSWRGSWKEGPNPSLPALSPDDVPKEMRASPLFPPLSKDDQTKAKKR